MVEIKNRNNMKEKKMLILILVIFLTSFSLQAQTKRLKTVEKEYSFNPDYPDFYYGNRKIFLELISYSRAAKVINNKRYVISFSGMTTNPNGTKKYIASNWGFDSLDEFKYYKGLIENKKYYRILLKEPKDGILSDIYVLMHPRRKIPKL